MNDLLSCINLKSQGDWEKVNTIKCNIVLYLAENMRGCRLFFLLYCIVTVS